MFKSVLIKILYYLSLSGFNTFYKYMVVQKNIYEYSFDSSFMNIYKTTSEVKVPYVNIFILSFVCVFLIDFIINTVLFYMNNKPLREIFDTLSYLKYVILIICAFFISYINIFAGLIFVMFGFIVYVLGLRKYFDKRSLVVVILLNLLNFMLFYTLGIFS